MRSFGWTARQTLCVIKKPDLKKKEIVHTLYIPNVRRVILTLPAQNKHIHLLRKETFVLDEYFHIQIPLSSNQSLSYLARVHANHPGTMYSVQTSIYCYFLNMQCAH